MHFPARALSLVCLCAAPVFLGAQTSVIQAVTFASKPGRIYVPLREVAAALGLSVDYDVAAGVKVGETYLDDLGPRLPSGATLIQPRSLAALGARIDWDAASQKARIYLGDLIAEIGAPPKLVVVDKTTQTLTAYQGKRVLAVFPVSTGIYDESTPVGAWVARAKERMRYSSKYNNAPMPWSVQVVGNIFLHGSPDVPKRPASHGCVRIPISGANPAQWLWNWIDIGTPISITGRWKPPGPAKRG